jgi:hypothetical protein
MRHAREYKLQSEMEKIEKRYKRIELQKQVRNAMSKKRESARKEHIIRVDRYQEQSRRERDVSPGPGEYSMNSTLAKTGGTWGRSVLMFFPLR